jgi:hypothetical protein
MAVFDFIEQNGIGAGFVYKNTTSAYRFDGTSFIQITDDDYPGVVPVTSITRSGSIATLTSTTNHGLVTGDEIVISGATQTEYNGTFTVTKTGNTTFTYTVTGTPATPATGTILANQVDSTVRGIVYLDGTYYVMTPAGSIYGSNLEDASAWSALNVIQSRMEPDGGVCLARQLNLIVAFSQYSTEFFYNAGNPTGSPLLPYGNAFKEIGCASANSVAQIENTTFFMGVAKAKGRSIYKLDTTELSMVSNPSIDRLLNADNLSDVSSYCIKLSGHAFYFLTLRNLGITLVYDINSGQWAKWTQLTLGSTQSITSMSWAFGQVTATKNAHGLSDGDCVVISSSTPSGYNGTYVVNVVDVNTFTFALSSSPGTYTSGAIVAKYVESYFNMASYTSGAGFDLVQDSTTGSIYAVDSNTYQDNGVPIKFRVRTTKFDGGGNKTKHFSMAEIIGDKVNATMYLRYSNDDYQTWSSYRPVDLSLQRSRLNRLGRGRRRAFDMINYDNQPIRVESLELTLDEGIS